MFKLKFKLDSFLPSLGDVGNEKLRSSLTSQRVALHGNAFRGNGTANSAGVGDLEPLTYDHRGCGGGADECGDRFSNRAFPADYLKTCTYILFFTASKSINACAILDRHNRLSISSYGSHMNRTFNVGSHKGSLHSIDGPNHFDLLQLAPASAMTDSAFGHRSVCIDEDAKSFDGADDAKERTVLKNLHQKIRLACFELQFHIVWNEFLYLGA